MADPATLHWRSRSFLLDFPRSSNGRTAAFGAVNRGSNPCRGANFQFEALSVLSSRPLLQLPSSKVAKFGTVHAGSRLGARPSRSHTLPRGREAFAARASFGAGILFASDAGQPHHVE